MIREHRGSLKVEERLDGDVWVLRFKATRDRDHKRVERTRVVRRVEDFPTEAQAFAEESGFAYTRSNQVQDAERSFDIVVDSVCES